MKWKFDGASELIGTIWPLGKWTREIAPVSRNQGEWIEEVKIL